LYGCLLILGRATLFSFSLPTSLGVLLIVAFAALPLCALAALIAESLPTASKSTTLVIWTSLALVGMSPVLWQAPASLAWVNAFQESVPHGVLLNALRALVNPGTRSLGALAMPAALLLASGLLLCAWIVHKCGPRQSHRS